MQSSSTSHDSRPLALRRRTLLFERQQWQGFDAIYNKFKPLRLAAGLVLFEQLPRVVVERIVLAG